MKGNGLLVVRNLTKRFYYGTWASLLRRKSGCVRAVDGVSLSIARGETLGVVGETGCGKTTLGRCILQLDRPTGGEVYFEGSNLCLLKGDGLRQKRQRLQMIFQDPDGALNPLMTVGDIVAEGLRIHGLANHGEHPQQIAELLSTVGLSHRMASLYPHQLSGGQRQRVAIARALSLRPSFVVCDEPVSALDVSVQAQIINLFLELQDTFGLAYLFISHDLAIVRHISHRVAVMYLGRIVEMAPTAVLYGNALHPYSQALLAAVGTAEFVFEAEGPHIALSGEPPSPLHPPSGCTFHPRCPLCRPVCRESPPPLRPVNSEWFVSCHLA